MDTEDKCFLIEEFVREYGKYQYSHKSAEFLEFLSYNDLGVPIAQAFVYDLAILTEEGEALIEETWVNLCNMLNSNPYGNYESIYDMGNLDNND